MPKRIYFTPQEAEQILSALDRSPKLADLVRRRIADANLGKSTKRRPSKIQERVFRAYRRMFPGHLVEMDAPLNFRGSGWRGKPYFVDILDMTDRRVIEVDGVQHNDPRHFFYGSDEEFHRAKRRDRTKQEILEEWGFSLLRVGAKELRKAKTEDVLIALLEVKINV